MHAAAVGSVLDTGTRRPTTDIDAQAMTLPNSGDAVRELVLDVIAIELAGTWVYTGPQLPRPAFREARIWHCRTRRDWYR